MPVLQVQDEFQSGDNVTATSLNDLVNEASFVSGAVDNSTLQVASAGHLKVKDNGILSNHLKSDASNDSVRAVTTNHIRNDAVTYAKIQNVSATDRVLGRNSTGAGNVEEITPTALRTMINVEDGATADQTASEIKTAYESNANTNAFTDAEKSKLTGIEAGATADQSASEIKTAYESNSNTNAFTDAEKSKLTGIAAGAEVNVQSDWNASSGDAFIKNKPSIPTNNTQLTNGAGYTTNTGTVTSVDSGTGLTGGPITTSGTLSIKNEGVDTTQLADNAVTSAKISDTDTQFLVDDTSTQKTVIINNALGDVDFIVKSTGNGNLIITDGANNAVGIGTTTNANFALTASNAAVGSSLVIYDPASLTEGGQININKAGITTPSGTESDGFVIDSYDTGSTGNYGLPPNTDVLRIIGTPGLGASEKSIVITEDADFITNGDIKFRDAGTNNVGEAGIEAGEVHSQLFVLKDGVTAPSTFSGQAAIYVDSADGDLKIKFSDGTVKTIVTDS